MRLTIFLFICFSLLIGKAQTKSMDSETFVQQFENGQLLDQESWFITIDSDTVSYYSLYQDTWVLIDYWSVTCRPCIQELPSMNAFASSHDISNFTVIAISVDDDQNRWLKLSPKRQLNFPNYFAGRSIENDIFGLNLSLLKERNEMKLTTTLPRYSLIDPNGRIVERELKVKPSDPGFKSYIESIIN